MTVETERIFCVLFALGFYLWLFAMGVIAFAVEKVRTWCVKERRYAA